MLLAMSVPVRKRYPARQKNTIQLRQAQPQCQPSELRGQAPRPGHAPATKDNADIYPGKPHVAPASIQPSLPPTDTYVPYAARGGWSISCGDPPDLLHVE